MHKMIRQLLLISFLLGFVPAFSQSSIDIRFEHEYLYYSDSFSYIHKLDKSINNKFHMLFNDSFSLIYYDAKIYKKALKAHIIGDKLFHHSYFYNSLSGEKFEEINYPDRGQYLLRDSINIMNWQFFEVTKKILGKTCKAALSVNNHNDSIIVWYTTDLKFKNGPIWYDSVPGVILESSDQKRNSHLKAKKINYSDQQLIPPTEGKKITIEEFRALRKAWDAALKNDTIYSRRHAN